RKIPL
ncbi:putative type III secretory flagellar biosynthesis, partial [Chlamydia psittaci 06-1683]